VKTKAVFLVSACVMLVRLSALKRGVLVEDRETESLCCCCDAGGCLLWDLGLCSLVQSQREKSSVGLVTSSNRGWLLQA